MNKLFIDKDRNIVQADEAQKRIEEQNDSKYIDELKGIHKVDLQRWKEAQYYEKKTWLQFELNSKDDRNYDHLSMFSNYACLQELLTSDKQLNYIELGCGPFTNTRLLLEKFNLSFNKLTLLDPLVFEYLNHPHCFYKDKKVNGKEVDLIGLPIEQLETEEKYDLLLITNVLEHCYDVHVIFDKILSVLKKDGILIFSDVYYRDEMAKKMTMEIYDAGHPIKLSETKMNQFLANFEPLMEREFVGLYGQHWRNDKYFIGTKK